MGAVSTRISVVAKDPQGCSPVSVRLAGCGFGCRTTSDSQRPRPLLADRQFDVLITGIGMPQVNGLDLLIHAKQHVLGGDVLSHSPAILAQITSPQSRNKPDGLARCASTQFDLEIAAMAAERCRTHPHAPLTPAVPPRDQTLASGTEGGQ